MAKEYSKLKVSEIIVQREKRQRRVIGTVQELADSIKRVGQINPITITRDNVLIAGERRLEACKLIAHDYKIAVRYVDELDPLELQLIELEENVKRSELSWQDQVRAMQEMHQVLCGINENWNMSKTAEHLGLAVGWVSRCLAVASSLEADPSLAKAESIKQASNIFDRKLQRAVDNELNSMMQVVEPAAERKPRATIENADFLSLAETYSGRKFTLIHCDFPYGIDHGESEQGNIDTGMFQAYDDGEEVYWNLCAALCRNLDKFLLPSGHVMFWFSMKFYTKTIEFFEKNSSLELVDERPLIWFKSDNKGIVSDFQRRPRNVYETALMFSRGDRKILSPISNCYACPATKTFHASEKPEPMLRHFFRMFVDEHAEVLDPTCGSGSSIRAAFELGAKRAVGYELNKEFAESANLALNKAKAFKQLEKEIVA